MDTVQEHLHYASWGLRTAGEPVTILELQFWVQRQLGKSISLAALVGGLRQGISDGRVRRNGDHTFSWLGMYAGR